MNSESDETPGFDLANFLPYLLNRAAETTSDGFRTAYRSQYGMLRTEWRVLFHLGRYGEMTATEIGRRASIHKTKISRAVAALETKRFLTREGSETDRRQEMLSLTAAGQQTFQRLTLTAARYDADLSALFSESEERVLRACLARLIERGAIGRR